MIVIIIVIPLVYKNNAFKGEQEIQDYLAVSSLHKTIQSEYEKSKNNNEFHFEHGEHKFEVSKFDQFEPYDDWTEESIFKRELSLIIFFIKRWGAVCCDNTDYEIDIRPEITEYIKGHEHKHFLKDKIDQFHKKIKNKIDDECVGIINEEAFKSIIKEATTEDLEEEIDEL